MCAAGVVVAAGGVAAVAFATAGSAGFVGSPEGWTAGACCCCSTRFPTACRTSAPKRGFGCGASGAGSAALLATPGAPLCGWPLLAWPARCCCFGASCIAEDRNSTRSSMPVWEACHAPAFSRMCIQIADSCQRRSTVPHLTVRVGVRCRMIWLVACPVDRGGSGFPQQLAQRGILHARAAMRLGAEPQVPPCGRRTITCPGSDTTILCQDCLHFALKLGRSRETAEGFLDKKSGASSEPSLRLAGL